MATSNSDSNSHGMLSHSEKRKSRRGMMSRLNGWWKKKSFYVVQADSSGEDARDRTMMEDSGDDDSSTGGFDTQSTTNEVIDRVAPLIDVPRSTVHRETRTYKQKAVNRDPPVRQTSRLARNSTRDSLQGSLESLDSLAESCWDPDDDSQVTPVAGNVVQQEDFFSEHVHFLRVQTQPRQVEIVWDKPQPDESFLADS